MRQVEEVTRKIRTNLENFVIFITKTFMGTRKT